MDLLTAARRLHAPTVLTALVLLLVACASTGDERAAGDDGADGDERAAAAREEEGRPSKGPSEATAVGAPGAPPNRTDAGAGTPRRRASERLVEEGKGYWIAGRDDAARARFQDALRLDGSNGAAYYYLATLAADARQWSDAEGYHAQAAALLSGRSEYRQPLADLAERIAARR